MLRITADVNGRAIGYLYAHHVGTMLDTRVSLYDAAVWCPDKPLNSVFGIEGLAHVREQGWMPLATLIMNVDAVRRTHYHTYK